MAGQTPRNKPVPEATDRRRRDAERVWYLALSLIFLLIVASAGIAAASVKPGFCAICHGKEASSLAKTAHAGESCDSCHTSPDAAGLIDSRLGVVGMIPAQILPGNSIASANVENSRCIVCHTKILAGVAESHGIRMSHHAVYEAKMACTQCHPGTAHSTVGPQVGYTMDMCLRCHTASSYDLRLCDTCHLKDSPLEEERGAYTTPWQITHGPNWRQTHGMGDLTTCKSCHLDNFCSTCHKMDLPHSPNFVSDHGQQVLARPNGATDCYVCHRKSSCLNCHGGVRMPHPSGFIRQHPKEVKARGSQSVCFRCHEKSSCTNCHTQHIHPGIPTGVLKRLLERPAR